jgi:nucleoside-diphosphate-sugar epimerase
MRTFVAGATGVIGLPTVERLVAAGHEVTAVGRSAAAADALRALGATPVAVDLFDPTALRDAVDGHDAVVNLATSIPLGTAATRRESWALNDRLRTEASANLVDAALAAGASVYVQESVAFFYEDRGSAWIDESVPLRRTPFTPAIAAAEANAGRFTAAGGRGVVLRFGGLFDARSAHTQQLLRAARTGVSLDVGVHDAYFPTVAAADAASAVVAALEEAPAGTYNVVDDLPMTHRQQTAVWAEVLGRPVRRLPVAVTRAAPLLAPLTSTSMRVSNRRLREATSWRPASPTLRETLTSIVGTSGGAPRRRLPGAARAGLVVLLLTGLGGGLWAQLSPSSFFTDFPLGRGWVAADGPYNEHLVRDYGGLNLALAVVTWAALRSRRSAHATTVALAWLAFAIPHFTYHLHHLDLYDGIDVAGNVVGTASTAVAALAVLATATRRPGRRVAAEPPTPPRVAQRPDREEPLVPLGT